MGLYFPLMFQVFICGDDRKAKEKVMEIVRSLGLTPLDKGSLLASKEIENYPLQLFPMWRFPIYLSFALSAFIFLYSVVRDIIYNRAENNKDYSFFIAVTIANRICPVVALVLLALVYLPGIFAAILQLYRGTKYSRFPDWLDKWMLCRKQLGLVALAYAFLHVLYTLIIPIRYFVRWRVNSFVLQQVSQSHALFSPTSTAGTILGGKANAVFFLAARTLMQIFKD